MSTAPDIHPDMAVLLRARENAETPAEADIDPARIAVAGDSAGSNLAAALSIAARDAGGPAICAQTLLYPCTGIDLALASYTDYAEGPGLTTASMAWFRDAYTPDATSLAYPLAWPAVAQDFSRLPPAFVHSAEIDPIRDEGHDPWLRARRIRRVVRVFEAPPRRPRPALGKKSP